jgi:ataxia telangiectasia mutated family protein
MNTIPGLSTAIKSYTSSKVNDRKLGHLQIRQIFGNRENLEAFQQTAGREGGAGWVAFYQCLFQGVVIDKRAALRPTKTKGITAGEGRTDPPQS